jgi:hypothetical protein
VTIVTEKLTLMFISDIIWYHYAAFASFSIECKTVFAGLVKDLESDKNGRYSAAALHFYSQISISYASMF